MLLLLLSRKKNQTRINKGVFFLAVHHALEKVALVIVDITEGSFGAASSDKANSIQVMGLRLVGNESSVMLAFDRSQDLREWTASWFFLSLSVFHALVHSDIVQKIPKAS